MSERLGSERFGGFLDRLPLIAILRGVTPDEVVPIGEALVTAGFSIIEVPLNSPHPLDSIRRLSAALPPTCLIGAGTVLDPALVPDIAAAGARLIVMPHGDAAVVRAAKAAGMFCTPGVATPTEGFAALANGADALKLFPAEALGAIGLKAWRSVFPSEAIFLPVGGITPETLGPFLAAGASGFGIGSALYKPGSTAHDVAANARTFADAWRKTQAQPAGGSAAASRRAPV
jgi:2-dehydro-3-deoxyphosphogalactonate aldolase